MTKQFYILLASLFITTSGYTQNAIIDFEDNSLAANSYYNGSDLAGSFTSGIINFNSDYDTSFGGYWYGGWALSSIVDSTTSGFGNLYGSKAASGHNSSKYAIGQQESYFSTPDSAANSIRSFYICNTTFAYNSMRDGDSFAKKFGGVSGNDEDYFLMRVHCYTNAGIELSNSPIDFYLADYRFNDNTLDYIVKDWTLVDLSFVSGIDKISIELLSSDTGSFGINTPLFYAIDDIEYSLPTGIEELNSSSFSIFPNPAKDYIVLNTNSINENLQVNIFNSIGQRIKSIATSNNRIDISDLLVGLYTIEVIDNNSNQVLKFIKQ